MKIFQFFIRVKILKRGCWQWQVKNNRKVDRYGVFKYRRKAEKAHRYSYRYFRGRIKPKLVLDHLCRNTMCVNPFHLEAVTDRVNVLRGNGVEARAKVQKVPK